MTVKNNPRKLQKKKQHEASAKKKMTNQRTKRRQEASLERKTREMYGRIMQLEKDMKSLSIWEEGLFQAGIDESMLSALEKNVLICKALEKEREQELAAKQEVNERLEEEGYGDLKKKIDVLMKEAVGSQQLSS